MLKLEPRPQASKMWSYGSPLLALAVTVLLGVLLFMALGKDPVKALLVFFWEPVRTPYALGELMWDPETGGGFDGLHADGVNRNQGAESTLAVISTFMQAQRFSHAIP